MDVLLEANELIKPTSESFIIPTYCNEWCVAGRVCCLMV